MRYAFKTHSMTLAKKKNLLLVIPLLALFSCNKLTKLLSKKEPITEISPPKAQKLSTWSVETYYLIQDVHPELGDRIMGKVQSQVLNNPTAIRKLDLDEIEAISGYRGGYGFAIHPSEVSNLSKLSRIQQIITDISKQEVVPLKLVSNIFNFQSVSGSAIAYTRIYGEASPGSVIEVDDGSGILVSALADKERQWQARIRQSTQLRARNGFVYIRISKGKAIQYLEMDVLSKQRKRVNYGDLPKNSILQLD